MGKSQLGNDSDCKIFPSFSSAWLAIYFLLPRKLNELTRARLLLACVAAAFAAFTSANGFLLGPVGLVIFCLAATMPESLAWCASFLLPLVAYLYHYTRVLRPADIGSYVTRPLFFLAFLGCGAIPSRWPAALLGLVILGILWLAFRSRFDRINPVACYFTVWIMATALLVAWVRGAVSFAIGSRYSIYSILVLVFVIPFLRTTYPAAGPLSTEAILRSLSCALCSICVLADVHAYKKLAARRQMVLSGIELYRANPDTTPP